MKYRFIKCFLLILCAAFLCTGCAQPEEAAVTEAPAVEEVEAAETAVPEEIAGAEEKAELPPPPDIDIKSWEFLYAGISQGVGRYHPEVRIWESQYMDSRCMDQTIAFVQAAREAGHTVWINSAYRNWDYRLFWFEKYIYEYGSAYEAAKHTFPSGCSDHHTGLGFCITDESNLHGDYNERYDLDIQDTEVYDWMVEHCTEYGFILRYPAGHEECYGMACKNAGHFRYVGQEAAQYITENNICFEEFLALYEE